MKPHKNAPNASVMQEWTHQLPFMQQTVLISAVRGPDNSPKYTQTKLLLRWYRRCVLLSAMDKKVITNPHEKGGGSFTGPSLEFWRPADHEYWQEPMDSLVGEVICEIDALPHHFLLHFMHAIEILGYKHPVEHIRRWWHSVYITLVNDMHLHTETEDEMDSRLGDDLEGWLNRNHPATIR